MIRAGPAFVAGVVDSRTRLRAKDDGAELGNSQLSALELLVLAELDEIALNRVPVLADDAGERAYSPAVSWASANQASNSSWYSSSASVTATA